MDSSVSLSRTSFFYVHTLAFVSFTVIARPTKQNVTYSFSSSQYDMQLSRWKLFIYITLRIDCNKRYNICMQVYTLIQNNLHPLFGTQCILLLTAIFIRLTCWMGHTTILQQTNKSWAFFLYLLCFLSIWSLKCFCCCCHHFCSSHILLFSMIRSIWRIICEWPADIRTRFPAENLEIVDHSPLLYL